MAKKSTKRQAPSKPSTLKPVEPEAMKTSTAAEDSATAGDLGATHDPQQEHVDQMKERTKEEIEAGKKKGKYKVLTEGAIFDNKNKSKVGDFVTLTADEADTHRKHGVALGPVDEK